MHLQHMCIVCLIVLTCSWRGERGEAGRRGWKAQSFRNFAFKEISTTGQKLLVEEDGCKAQGGAKEGATAQWRAVTSIRPQIRTHSRHENNHLVPTL